MEQFLDIASSFYGPWAYIAIVFVLLACGFGLPIPEDITLAVAAILAYNGIVHLELITVLSFFSVLVGDSTIFFLGHRYGRRLARKKIFRRIFTEEKLDIVQKKLRRKGARFIFFARFMPGLRAPVYFASGTLHYPFKKFLLLDGIAALLSVPLIIGVIHYFGDEVNQGLKLVRRVENGIIILIAVLITYYVLKRAIKKYVKRRQENGIKSVVKNKK